MQPSLRSLADRQVRNLTLSLTLSESIYLENTIIDLVSHSLRIKLRLEG